MQGKEFGQYNLAVLKTDGAKIGVIASNYLLDDQFLSNNQENLALALNMVDYLSRITSYNVCYTKLLRIFGGGTFGNVDVDVDFVEVLGNTKDRGLGADEGNSRLAGLFHDRTEFACEN